MDSTFVLLAFGLALSFFMAWNLGANDAATPTDCAVGAGVISIKKAVVLFALFSTIGALSQGFMTIKTIGTGIVPNIDVIGALTITLPLPHAYGLHFALGKAWKSQTPIRLSAVSLVMA